MPLNRFQFLCSFIELGYESTRQKRWEFDKFICVRDFFKEVNANFNCIGTPSVYLTYDETFFPYHGRIGINQCNCSNPAKYGILCRKLCDTKVLYTY